MSNRISSIVAYAALSGSDQNQSCDLELLRKWCQKVAVETEILAEEVNPSEPSRPLWAEVLAGIDCGTVKTVVVPSLFHIAGADLIGLSKLLTVLKAKGVILKSLAEVIDSRRESRNEIILQLAESVGKTCNARGVQLI